MRKYRYRVILQRTLGKHDILKFVRTGLIVLYQGQKAERLTYTPTEADLFIDKHYSGTFKEGFICGPLYMIQFSSMKVRIYTIPRR